MKNLYLNIFSFALFEFKAVKLIIDLFSLPVKSAGMDFTHQSTEENAYFWIHIYSSSVDVYCTRKQ